MCAGAAKQCRFEGSGIVLFYPVVIKMRFSQV
jgi:hypothetical protein